jgi:hypothetical protein
MGTPTDSSCRLDSRRALGAVAMHPLWASRYRCSAKDRVRRSLLDDTGLLRDADKDGPPRVTRAVLRSGTGEQNKEGPGSGLPRHMRGKCVGIGTGRGPNSEGDGEDEDEDDDDARMHRCRSHQLAGQTLIRNL